MKLLHHVTKFALVAAMATGGVAAIAQAPASAVDCTGACITNVVKTPDVNKVTIAWKTTVPAKARLRLEKAGVEVARVDRTTFLTSHKLTTPSVLQPSTQYKYYLRATDQAGHVKVVSGFITTKAPAPTGCAIDCIQSVTPTPRGSRVEFLVGNTVAGTLKFDVRNLDGTLANSVSVPKAAGAGITSVALPTGKRFTYTVTLTDAAGKSWTEGGSTYTLRRKVRFTVDSIKVVDDSDSIGAGDFDVNLRLEGGAAFRLYHDRSIDSGATVYPNYSAVLYDTDTVITLDVEMWDDDCDFGETCMSDVPTWNSGSNSVADWHTVSVSPVVDANVDEAEKTYYVFGNAAVKFAVSGRVSVEYVMPL